MNLAIKKDILKKLNNQIGNEPPESGGILGYDKHSIISEIAFDKPTVVTHPCSYYPNVNYLNGIIKEWNDNGIKFAGIFHTHFLDVETLSVGDKIYIRKILSSIPVDIDKLYFPIYTLPGRKLILYSAYLIEDNLIINREHFKII